MSLKIVPGARHHHPPPVILSCYEPLGFVSVSAEQKSKPICSRVWLKSFSLAGLGWPDMFCLPGLKESWNKMDKSNQTNLQDVLGIISSSQLNRIFTLLDWITAWITPTLLIKYSSSVFPLQINIEFKKETRNRTFLS